MLLFLIFDMNGKMTESLFYVAKYLFEHKSRRGSRQVSDLHKYFESEIFITNSFRFLADIFAELARSVIENCYAQFNQ